MRGITPKARAKALDKILKRVFDEYAEEENVVDMLTDLRHLCDAKGWEFGELDRIAYQHYLPENQEQAITI
jgi:hypothetical protein